MLTLKDLLPGESAKIKQIEQGAPIYRHKLLSLGIIPGAVLKVIRRAPLGCPVEVQVHGSRMCLRSHEAAIVCLERV